jgi:hypothetical protein
MRFYERAVPVIQLNEPWRYPEAAVPPEALRQGRLLYLVPQKRDRSALIRQSFTEVAPPQTVGAYRLYAAAGPKSDAAGRMP